jgi:hypothetical protein
MELAAKKGRIFRGEIRPFLWQIVHCKNRRYRTYRDACAAIDTFDRVDIDHIYGFELGVILFRMDAIYRASIHASCVFGADAGFCNYVSHMNCLKPLL